jgi:FdhD protein
MDYDAGLPTPGLRCPLTGLKARKRFVGMQQEAVPRSGFTAWRMELARKAGSTPIGRTGGKRFLATAGLERIESDADPTEGAYEALRHRRKCVAEDGA